MPISWSGGFEGPTDRHLWQSHGVSGDDQDLFVVFVPARLVSAADHDEKGEPEEEGGQILRKDKA